MKITQSINFRQVFFLVLVLLIINFLPTSLVSSGLNLSKEEIRNIVLPQEGVVLPVKWNDLGRKMIEAGVIDANKLEALYNGRLSEDDKSLIYGENNGNLKITRENSGVVLNLLWAFGLSNKNQVLENGPMTNPKYGGAENFASTGGWTLAQGGVMEHYSQHEFVVLNQDQQALVEKVSRNIYRPCCGNSTYFPDCNHGMAMLGLLELLVSQGADENEMYKIALVVNSYWFPDAYTTIARYFAENGYRWSKVSPKIALGYDFSSSMGYQNIVSGIKSERTFGIGCGV